MGSDAGVDAEGIKPTLSRSLTGSDSCRRATFFRRPAERHLNCVAIVLRKMPMPALLLCNVIHFAAVPVGREECCDLAVRLRWVKIPNRSISLESKMLCRTTAASFALFAMMSIASAETLVVCTE